MNRCEYCQACVIVGLSVANDLGPRLIQGLQGQGRGRAGEDWASFRVCRGRGQVRMRTGVCRGRGQVRTQGL